MKIKNVMVVSLLTMGMYLIHDIEASAFNHNDMELVGAETRKERGSNYWLSSNLREWLNSDSSNVRYTQIPPSAGNVNKYPYDKEAGFLSGFTESEKNAIAITERGNLFGANDTKATTNGKTATAGYNHNNSKSINFEYPSYLKSYNDYGKVVANDKVFLLNFKELTEYVQNRGWAVMKKASPSMAKKYGYTTTSNVAYHIYHPIQNIGSEYFKMVSSNPNAVSVDTHAMMAQGLAPALNLKPTANVKRIKEYNINSTTESWTNRVTTVQAKNLNIGDIVEFGSHLGETIKWRVINITSDGFPLLLSENVIDVKAFDAKGDTSQRFSYIDLEDVFPVADVSMVDFKITNIQKSSDITAPSIELLNEDKLFERSNNSFIMNLKIEDVSGISYVRYPNGSQVNVNGATTHTFNYEVSANGNYEFGFMDINGNFRYFVLPVGNINLPPKVEVNPSTSSWTNKDVTIGIKASNDVGWTTPGYNQSGRDSGGGSWGNYTTYIGKKIRLTGKVEYVSDKNNFNASHHSYGPGFQYKRIVKNADEYNLTWTWPLAWSENLNKLKQRKLNGEGPTEFDVTYTVGNDYFGNLSSRTHITMTVANYGNATIKWSDIKYELLDNDDFAITKIELPNGESKSVTSYTDIISKEGENTLAYKVHDNRGMITSRTVTTKIDKSKPTISVTGNPTSWTNKDVTLKLTFKDSVSGIKEITLPNGKRAGNNQKEIKIDYPVTKNGSYTFTVTDQANNTTTQTVVVNRIDKTAPIISYTLNPNTWTKNNVVINVTSIDNESGLKMIVLPDGNIVNSTSAKYTVTLNGIYYFKSIDNLGAETILPVKVSNIDKLVPNVSVNNNQNWVNKDVSVNLSGKD